MLLAHARLHGDDLVYDGVVHRVVSHNVLIYNGSHKLLGFVHYQQKSLRREGPRRSPWWWRLLAPVAFGLALYSLSSTRRWTMAESR